MIPSENPGNDSTALAGASLVPCLPPEAAPGAGSAGEAAANRALPVQFGLRRLVPWIVGLGVAAAFFIVFAPWKTLEFWPGEGVQFSRALLLLKHPDAVSSVWSEQSWFYPQACAAIFGTVGMQPWIPRLFSFLTMIAALSLFPRLMPPKAGWPHLLFATFFLYSWPELPILSISADPELPAFALAVVAAALLPRSPAEFRPWRFAVCGVILAFAIQIAFSAVLIIPAIVVRLVAVRHAGPQPTSAGHLIGRWRGSVLTAGCLGVAFFLLAWLDPSWNWEQVVRASKFVGTVPEEIKTGLSPGLLLAAPAMLVAALLGVAMLLRLREWREAAFAVGLLLTGMLVHLVRKDYLAVYGIHFAVPLALLGGWGAGELFRLGLRDSRSPLLSKRIGPRREVCRMLAALVVSLWIGLSAPHISRELYSMKALPPVAGNEALQVLESYQNRAKSVYTRHNVLAAQAGYLLPPELTVVPSGGTENNAVIRDLILGVVKRDQCDILVLADDLELKQDAWQQLVGRDYVKVWWDNAETIFVTRRLNPKPVLVEGKLQERLGL